jgi:hypothetical protein
MTSLMHSQKPYERLRVFRKLRGLCLIDHLTRFQHISAIGDRQRAVEFLLDQEDRKPLLLEAGAGVASARNWPLLRQVIQSTSDVAAARQDDMGR